LPFWRVLPLTTRFTLRNLFRSWKRSLMTILAIGGAASLLITSFCMHDSAYFFVDHQYHKVIHGDATLKFRNFLGFQGQIDLSKIPGIFYYETYFPLTVTFRNGNLQKKGVILGLPPDPKLRTPRKKDGSLIFIPSEGLVLTQKMAENLHVQKGDILFFQPIEGKRKWFSVPVKEIVQEYVGLSVYASSRYLARLMGESFTFSQSAVKVIPKKESLFFRKLKKLPSLAGYSNIKEERHLLEGLLVENMLVMIFTALFFGGIMYLGAIYNHTLVSLGERSKEIALLRVLGFTSKEVSLQLFQENMILLGLGTILGFPLGYLLSKIVVLELNTDLYRFPLVIYQESYLWTLLLGILFGVFAHWIVVQKVKSFPWLEEINLRE
ncbi:MAG: ABC transporter permease, partial [Planctomycetota bacterium]